LADEAALQKSVELNGHFPRYRIDLAEAYLILNQVDEAIEQPEHARALDLTQKAICLRLAIACCCKRAPKKVKEMLEMAEKTKEEGRRAVHRRMELAQSPENRVRIVQEYKTRKHVICWKEDLAAETRGSREPALAPGRQTDNRTTQSKRCDAEEVRNTGKRPSRGGRPYCPLGRPE
jgi:hypothetical protein